jgi:tetratricopeptide (TPR) repeat protein
LNSQISYFRAALSVPLALMMSMASLAQTYKVNSGTTDQNQQQADQPKSDQQKAKQPQRNAQAQAQSNNQSQSDKLGWGSNIQNARLARAAESALKSGNYSAAMDFAQRAAQSAPGDDKLWFLLGYTQRLAGKEQASVESYDRGLRINPSSLEGQSGLAQTFARMGRTDEAVKLLAHVVESDSRRITDILLLGEMLLQAGQFDEALKHLQRAEQTHADARSELLIAITYERLNQDKQAERYLDMAKHRAPNNPEVVRALAGFYRAMGNYSAAIAALKSLPNKSPEVKAELAYTYQLAGKQEEAAKLYVEAANAAPHDVNLQLSAAQSEITAGDVDTTVKYLDRAEKLNANHYRLHAIRGEVAKLEERNEDAVKEYNTALSNLPLAPAEGPLYSIQLHINLVQIYARLQDDAAAKSQLTIAQSEINALDLEGKSREDFLRLRSQIKLYAGDTSGALQDIHDALALNPKDPNALQLNGDLLVKIDRGEEALDIYKKILTLDPDNELALTSLGSVSRQLGHDKEAEKYLLRLAATHPRYYASYLALGDLYTARRDFNKAEANYRKAHSLAPKNTLAIAGGMNAAIEAHQFALAGEWLNLASEQMQQDPFIMREKERYFSWIGDYKNSAIVGEQLVQKLPRDRDVVVYLGYDLLHLERYDELLALATKYQDVLPKEPDLPLLAGYVYKHNGDLAQAQAEFTRSIERGPNVATAYVNRGFVLHDQRQGVAAAADFNAALKIEPKNGEAHLGLAYADLDLRRPRPALEQAKLAEKAMGDSMALHLIRGTAYGNEGLLKRAIAEFRLALKSNPGDPNLHVAIADALYELHEYQEAINDLLESDKLAPGSGLVYAQLARCYAQLHQRNQTMHYIELAEKAGPATVYVSTGEALSVLGEQKAAMARFERALSATGTDRVEVRLAIAHLMMNRGQVDDTRRQVTLALMEAGAGRTDPPTATELVQAADVFLGMHEYQLAQIYFQRALAAGAPESDVRVGLANTYLATGDTTRAEAQLDEVSKNLGDDELSYNYLLAKANTLRQRHQNALALTAFAQAAQAAGEDTTAELAMLRTSGDEGLRINHTISFVSDYTLSPIFEDTTVYPLDAAFAGGTGNALPPPRSSIQSLWTEAFHLHIQGMPDSGGFFQVRNARGEISLPSANTIVDRDTWDYNFNYGINPSLRWGDNIFNFNTGIQETIRRDSLDPYNMNQNLFRQFVYMSTSSFFNWVSINGFAIREAGPFTENSQRSRDLSGALEFRVGRPWAKNALITGWGARDEQFSPIPREFYYTSTYAGIERRFSDRLKIRAIGEYLRSWRVEISQYAIAQAFRPAGNVEFSPTRNWTIQASAAYSRNMGIHAYDTVQSGFAVSYAMPIRRTFQENGQDLPVHYPIRFSAGIQQENFFNFGGPSSQQFRPYAQVSIF